MAFLQEQDKVAHLLRRFGLGANKADMEFYGGEGYEAAVEKLINYDDFDEEFELDPSIYENAQNAAVSIRGFQYWWYLRLIATKYPLEQKLTLFWHDHFATSAQKVTIAEAMYRYLETLRLNATGRFEDLLVEVSKDPAMLFWLDNNENVKGTPNENFAREVMELFTLGVDNKYTEQDIREAARALTGWVYGTRRGGQAYPAQYPYRSTRYMFVEERHDTGDKDFLGENGKLDGDDVLEILLELPETSEYITWKMWEWFVYDDPEKEIIQSVASDWRKSGLDILELVRLIAMHPNFFDKRAIRTHVKNPVEFAVGAMRSLGIAEKLRQQFAELDADKTRGLAGPVTYVHRSTAAMGMDLLFPPDVAGWVKGEEWINTATIVERIKFADYMFGGASNRWLALVPENMPKAGCTPEELVDHMLTMFDVEMNPKKTEVFVMTARKVGGEKIAAGSLYPAMRQVARLMFGTPEFQFI